MEQPKNTVPDHIVKRIDDLMVAGEKWLGILQPSPQRLISDTRLSIGFVILIILSACSMITFLIIDLLKPSSLIIVIIILLILWLIVISIRSIRRMMNPKEHIYAITTQRLIIILPNAAPKSYGKRDITELSLHNLKPNGSGDIIFRQEPMGKRGIQIGFLGVPDVYKVRQLILDTFEFEQTDFWSR